MKIFITGDSSGIGRGLAEYYLNRGEKVYGLARRDGDERAVRIKADLSNFSSVSQSLAELFKGVQHLDRVILSAGVLGEIKDLRETSLEEMDRVMQINVWSNKIVADWLVANIPGIKQIVMISSGAAVNGNRGWGAYSISKAALNMLTKLYAAEVPNIHWSALAPGLVDTAMQDYLCAELDPEVFPSVQKLRAARGTENMPSPKGVAERLDIAMNKLLSLPSGTFEDIRKMV